MSDIAKAADNDKCWACGQVAKHHPDPVPMSALAEVAGRDIGLCDRHWSWWVAHWMNSEFTPGCSSHVITSEAAEAAR